MGYSIDDGQTAIVPTSFSASVAATAGPHILHVKCWGQGVNDHVELNITVVAAAGVSNINVVTPGNGAQVVSPFRLSASTTTCASKPAVSMGYSIDDGTAVIEPTSFNAAVGASLGPHILHVKCWGKGVADQLLLGIDVIQPTSATPLFAPAPGTYRASQLVSVSSATPGAVIYYTTNGNLPVSAWTRYSTAIQVNQTQVIEAVAVARGYNSSGLGRGDYIITPPSNPPVVPSNAVKLDGIQLLPNWQMEHDSGTPGTADGSMALVSTPSLSGQAAEFTTSFSDWGGERYSVSYATDPDSTNFLYDAEVYIASGSIIGNLEMDNNQVIGNGDTVIYAFQCAGDSNTWDYSENAGTRAAPVVEWIRSNAPCNPASWAPDVWHHVQISYSRDEVGNVTYNAVWLDGVETVIGVTAPSAFPLGWASGDLLTNFQVDGAGASGSSTLYLDNLTVYRW